ncbi:hypothetical protein OG402_38395 [Streptomyces anulatus]|uniref:hypothetical protein n=1 Tax=Streptomyces anulatus TaxID=1892 RepID=UPI00225C2122|nr:hypothetical protein [Streptomyces anulatus]MCX4516082.1 hypothetical protein [Streptomyces anulatus]MCX4523311.1 hypothetical protein [Streptomyces anulatus]MCX4598909.1 hypothetical protein [Streptomyces anulatus]MCX4606321.1 hypothetical protein [Streptomyces anulatus]
MRFDAVEAISPLSPEIDRHAGSGPLFDDLAADIEGLLHLSVAAGEVVESPLGVKDFRQVHERDVMRGTGPESMPQAEVLVGG